MVIFSKEQFLKNVFGKECVCEKGMTIAPELSKGMTVWGRVGGDWEETQEAAGEEDQGVDAHGLCSCEADVGWGLAEAAISLVGASGSRVDHFRCVVECILIGNATVGTNHEQGCRAWRR